MSVEVYFLDFCWYDYYMVSNWEVDMMDFCYDISWRFLIGF